MTRRLGLRGRVFLSYLVVVVAVAGVGIITVQLLTPQLFENGMQGRAGWTDGTPPGPGAGGSAAGFRSQVEQAYDNALLTALVIAGAVGLVIAVLLAFVFSRRVLQRLRDVQDAAHELADGHYDRVIPVPPEPELADLVTSVNALGAALASTEHARAQLVSDLAHELRNPLTTIEGYMEGLIDGVLPPTIETYTEVANEAQRLKRLTADLSVLSQADEGAIEYHLVPVDLAEAARRTAARLRPQFEVASVEMALVLPEALTVNGDGERLDQVLTNLLGNAVAHTPPGGSVTVHGERVADSCVLEVVDTGEGIPPDQLNRVFDRFTRLGGGTGTGIGLNIARTITTAHGGTLVAHSDGAGTGARFVLTLPAVSLPAPGTGPT